MCFAEEFIGGMRKMRSEILDRVVADLLSVPALIFRGVRRTLIKAALDDIGVDISPLHFEIMTLLEEAGTLHTCEIGERLRIARAQMTHLVDKLVDLGIVEREMDTVDRRMTKIVLTGKGEAIFKEHDSDIRNATKEILSGLTDEELEDLSDSLRKIRDILSKL
jgi:DNA-binding MarR family transcriptional regulator